MREDFKKQLRGGAQPPRLIPGMQVGDPKRRIIILFGLLVLLVFMAAMLQGYSNRPETQEITAEAPPSKEIPGSRDPRFSGVPTLDRKYLQKIHDATPKEQEKWDEEAIAYLMTEARNTPAVLAYKRKLIPIEPASIEMFDNEPQAWRFQFVRFQGEIEYMMEGDYADISKGGDESVGRVHYGRVRLAGTEKKPARVVFITPTRPQWTDYNTLAITPEIQIIKDGWVRGRGMFVKKFRDVGPDGEEHETFLVVATRIKRDFKKIPVESLDSIPFHIIQDHAGLLGHETSRKLLFKTYPKTLFRLLRWAIPRAGPDGKALREKEGLKAESIGKVKTYEEIVSNPQEWRVKYVGALGALAMDPLYVGPEDIEDDKANDAGIDSYMTGWAVTDDSRLLQFVAPSKFGKLDLKRLSRVYFAGYFYKTQGYHSRDGTQRLAPFLVLTELREVFPTPPDHTVELFIAAGFIAGVGLLIFIIVREDKTKQDYRRWRRKQVL